MSTTEIEELRGEIKSLGIAYLNLCGLLQNLGHMDMRDLADVMRGESEELIEVPGFYMLKSLVCILDESDTDTSTAPEKPEWLRDVIDGGSVDG